MTAPVSHGYPDFGRFAATADIEICRQSNVGINADTNVNLGFVGSLPYLGHTTVAVLSNLKVNYAFYSDASYTNQVGNMSAQLQQGGRFEEPIPVLGPFLQVQIFANAYPATYSLIMWMQPEPGYNNAGDAFRTLLFNQIAVSYAVGTTVTTTSNCFYGALFVQVRIPDAGSQVRFQTIDRNGAVHELCRFFGSDPLLQANLWLPPATLQARVTNAGGVAQAFDVFANCRPWHAGV